MGCLAQRESCDTIGMRVVGVCMHRDGLIKCSEIDFEAF